MAGIARTVVLIAVVGIGIDVAPEILQIVGELVLRSASVGMVLHMLSLAVSIWVAAGLWLRVGVRTRLLLSALGLLQFLGAIVFGVVFGLLRARAFGQRFDRGEDASASTK